MRKIELEDGIELDLPTVNWLLESINYKPNGSILFADFSEKVAKKFLHPKKIVTWFDYLTRFGLFEEDGCPDKLSKKEYAEFMEMNQSIDENDSLCVDPKVRDYSDRIGRMGQDKEILSKIQFFKENH